MNIQSFAQDYLEKLTDSLKELSLDDIAEVAETIYQGYLNGCQVFIMGNGGSASTASHFACDLGKGTIVLGKPRFRVISLNDNVALMTALSNDFGYENIFVEQLTNLLNPGDIVIAITASGNSENILRAVEYAKSKGAITIGFIGFGGGKLRSMADLSIVISSRNYGRVEDVHLILEHLICQYLERKLNGEGQ